MSVRLRRIIESSRLGLGLAPKCVLLHLADAAQDPELVAWRSKRRMAAQLETDFKTIARNLDKLARAGFVSLRGERRVNGGAVDIFAVKVAAILRTPPVEAHDPRPEIAAEIAEKAAQGGSGSEPAPQWLRASTVLVQNHPNGVNGEGTESFAKKRVGLNSALYARTDDHLDGNPDFAAWVDEKEAQR